MVKAIWKDTVIAECDNTEIVEGNHYFPPECVKKDQRLRITSLFRRVYKSRNKTSNALSFFLFSVGKYG